MGWRPLRRTDLLAQRIEQMLLEGQKLSGKVAEAQQGWAEAQAAQAEVAGQLAQAVQELSALEAEYAEKQRMERPQRFQAENATNPAPIEAIFRLDAGFGTQENLALLIEMGYQIYSKPYGKWLSGLLAEKSTDPQDWQPVGANAEMKACSRIFLTRSTWVPCASGRAIATATQPCFISANRMSALIYPPGFLTTMPVR